MSSLRARYAVLVAGLLLLPALPATAASGITSPGADEVVAVDAVVPLRAVVDEPASGPSELSLLAPGADTAEVVAAATGPGELGYDFDTACATAVCTEPAPAPNGSWTVRLSGAAQDERTFVVRIPPAVPLEVSAAPSEAGVIVRWQRGVEPDLRAHQVEDSDGKVVRGRIGLEACDAERFCSVEVPESAGAWAVRAFRATCPDCSELLASAPSSLVRAGDSGPPVQAPSAEPSAAPTTTSAPRQRPNQGAAFRDAFGANRGAAAAPASPRRAAQAAPRLPDGSFDAELGYDEREIVVTEPRAPVARATRAVSSALWTGERLLLLVLSVFMVGGAIWLGRWARRAPTD